MNAASAGRDHEYKACIIHDSHLLSKSEPEKLIMLKHLARYHAICIIVPQRDAVGIGDDQIHTIGCFHIDAEIVEVGVVE